METSSYYRSELWEGLGEISASVAELNRIGSV